MGVISSHDTRVLDSAQGWHSVSGERAKGKFHLKKSLFVKGEVCGIVLVDLALEASEVGDFGGDAMGRAEVLPANRVYCNNKFCSPHPVIGDSLPSLIGWLGLQRGSFFSVRWGLLVTSRVELNLLPLGFWEALIRLSLPISGRS